MSTQPTNLPVPSESPRDLKFNAGKFDEFVTSDSESYTDRFGGDHLTISGMQQIYMELLISFGLHPVGSFQAGGEIMTVVDIMKDDITDIWYRWDDPLTLPKTAPPGSTPQTTGGINPGAWQPVNTRVQRELRVPEAYIPPVPDAASRKNKSLEFDDNGEPITVTPIRQADLDAEAAARQAADAALQDQISGTTPPLASAFSPISWHDQVIPNSITIPDNKNAWSFGPTITVADGQSVTVGENSFWTIANGQVQP